MEQALWLWIGIISVIIGIGIVSKVIIGSVNDSKDSLAGQSIEVLKTQCDFVCKEETGTRLGVKVNLPSGTLLTTKGRNICVYYNGKPYCAACPCDLATNDAGNPVLNLTGSEATGFFVSHSYSCVLYKEPPVSIQCTG